MERGVTMRLGKEPFYLYREDGTKVIVVEYCRDCGNRYFVNGIAKTIYEHINEKKKAKEILEFKATHNLFFEKELGDQMTLEDLL